jgi:arsenate reductase
MTDKVQIYHNPRCSKSRQTLALLEEQGITPSVIEYLKETPDEKTLRSILKKLGKTASEIIRKKDFKDLAVPEPASEDSWIKLMLKHPTIIERPIVVKDNQARLGRPPEDVLEIL